MLKNKQMLFLPKKYVKINAIIITLVIALCIFGCIMVYSASSYSALHNYNNEYHFLIKQMVGVILGIVAMCFTYFIDYRVYKRWKWVFIIVAIVALVLVFIPGIGVSNYGARRWIQLPGFTIQGSEVAKFCYVIFCAIYLSDKQEKTYKFKTFLPVIGIGLVLCVLIMLEPNMSITMVVGLTMVMMLFIGGMKMKHFAIMLIPIIIAVPVLILIEPYRLKRLLAFVNPWASPQGEGFQLIQSLYSLGSGGLFGVGLFNSRQKYLYLPFSESDFIFSIIGEELGLLGATIVIICFVVLIINLLKIAMRATDRFACFTVFGITSVLALQVLINLAVVTGSIPPTGVPLPLISAGSSSLIVFMAAIGVALNINRTNSNPNCFNIIKFKEKIVK